MDHISTDFLKVLMDWPGGYTRNKADLKTGKLFFSHDRSERSVTDVTHPFGESGCRMYFDYIIACIRQIVNYILCRGVEWPQMEVISKRKLQVRTETYQYSIFDGTNGYRAGDFFGFIVEELIYRGYWLSGISDEKIIGEEFQKIFTEMSKCIRPGQKIETALVLEEILDESGAPIEIVLKVKNNSYSYEKRLPIDANETDLASIKAAMIAGKRFPIRAVEEVSEAGAKARARNDLILRAAREISDLGDRRTYEHYQPIIVDQTTIRVINIGVQTKKEKPRGVKKPGMVILRQSSSSGRKPNKEVITTR